ncbi:hypothetical protein FRC02_001436 [Tulasnella sp. 418]|nr:hypothetical protein FRC02_001436 [Tulasnella sp. 418]
MSSQQNPAIVFNSIPNDYPIPGETLVYNTTSSIDISSVQLNEGILVKVLFLSIDPYMRGKMRDPSKPSYSPPYELGKPIDAYGVGVVVRSEVSDFKPGDHISATLPLEKYAILPSNTQASKIDNQAGLPWHTYIFELGMVGKTAWIPYKAFVKPKKGEVIFVSTGAGAVGSLVCQLAKLDGLKIIASTGSDEKVQYLKELGVDVAFNYKTESTKEILKKHGPIDIYWDHVGGETLEIAIDNINNWGRIISVGAIAEYNGQEPYGVKNLRLLFAKNLSVHGFIVGQLERKIGNLDFYEGATKFFQEGKFNGKVHLVEGLDKAPQLLLDVLKGKNEGKAIVKVADD